MQAKASGMFSVLLLGAVSGVVACSGNPIHQLQSISITPSAASGPNATFTAIGTYNGPPMTVSPQSVSWVLMGPGIDPPPADYTLVSSAYIASHCVPASNLSPLNYTIIAITPTSPIAPQSGTIPTQVFDDMVIARTTTAEGGFVSATAQLTCP